MKFSTYKDNDFGESGKDGKITDVQKFLSKILGCYVFSSSQCCYFVNLFCCNCHENINKITPLIEKNTEIIILFTYFFLQF